MNGPGTPVVAPPSEDPDLLAAEKQIGINHSQASDPNSDPDLLAAEKQIGVGAPQGPLSQAQLTPAQAFFDKTANSAAFGMGPQIAGAMGAVGSLVGPNHDLSGYATERDKAQQQLAQDQYAHPTASTLGNVTGAVVSPIGGAIGHAVAPVAGAIAGGTGLASALGRGAIEGAAQGAAYGAGSTQGDALDRLRGGLAGAGYGLAGGAAIGAAGYGLGKGAQAIQQRFFPSATDAAVPLSPNARSLLQEGVNQSDAGGATSSPGDVSGDQMSELVRWARARSPAARAEIDPFFQAREADRLPQIQGAIEDAVGQPRGSLDQDVESIAQQRATDAEPAYQKAYASAPIKNPDVLKTLQLPEFQKAYQRGQSIARLEGIDIPDLTSPPPEMSSTLLKSDPKLAKMVSDQIASQSGGPSEGVPIQAIDYTKRGVQDMIRTRMAGEGMGPTQARALTQRLNDMLSQVDQEAPDYASARSQYASHSALLDAASQGADDFTSLKTSARDVQQTLSGLSQDEQALYKRGALDQLMKGLENASGSATGSADLVRKLYSSVGGRAKIETLIGDPQKFQAFDQAMQQIASQRAGWQAASGNSSTFGQAAIDQLIGAPKPSLGVGDVARFVTSPKSTAMKFGMSMFQPDATAVQQATAAERARVAQEVAPYLTSPMDKLRTALAQAPKPVARGTMDPATRAAIQSVVALRQQAQR